MFGNSLVSVIADFICALLIRATGRILQTTRGLNLKFLGLDTMLEDIGNLKLFIQHCYCACTSMISHSAFVLQETDEVILRLFLEIMPSGDIAALVYLWNPFTIFTCVGFNTSPVENLFVVLSLYGASAGKKNYPTFIVPGIFHDNWIEMFS